MSNAPETPKREPDLPPVVDTPLRWLVRTFAGGLGIVALVRYLRRQTRSSPSAAAPPGATSGPVIQPPPHVEEVHYPGGEIEHPTVRFEATDVNFRWILGLLIGSIVCAMLVHYLVLIFFFRLRERESQVKRSPYPLAPHSTQGPPAAPRIEQIDRMLGSEASNVGERQTINEDRLNSYGLTEEKGYVHIPIEEAMKRLAGKLPVRSPPPPQPRSNGLVDWGGPNSGRLFREKPLWEER